MNKTYKPGDSAEKDVTLYVKDSKGKTLSQIQVPKGHRVPPTRIKGAAGYSTSK